jgi:hypothetical protein
MWGYILFFLFGKKAHSKKSRGRLWRGRYRVTKGIVEKGDMIFFD